LQLNIGRSCDGEVIMTETDPNLEKKCNREVITCEKEDPDPLSKVRTQTMKTSG
jgi:hypothetical protein